jgi:DNA-damage-inducible protein J
MTQTTLNVSIDTDLLKVFEKFCSEAGMSASEAFNKFARAVVRDKRLFVAVAAKPSHLAKKELMRRIKNLENGGGVFHDQIEDTTADDE